MVQVLVERESEYSVSTLTMEVSMSYSKSLYKERVPDDLRKQNNICLKHIAKLEKQSGIRKVGKRYMRWLATLDDTTRNDLLMAASERSTLIRLSNTLDIFKGILEEK